MNKNIGIVSLSKNGINFSATGLQEHPFRWATLDAGRPCIGQSEIDLAPADLKRFWEAEYENDCEKHKVTSRHFADRSFPPVARAELNRLSSPAMTAALARLFNLPGLFPDPHMHGGGLHVTYPGGWLQMHLDYELHPKFEDTERRINVIQFIGDKWQEGDGGKLILGDKSGRPAVAIDPIPGSIVVFECGPTSYHGVSQVTGKGVRISLAAYFLAKARPTASRTRALFLPNRQSPNCPAEVK